MIVTGIGMLVLFLALALLYGLMYVLTEFIRDPPRSQVADMPGAGVDAQRELRRRAAVMAVALARAEHEESALGPLQAQERFSPWRTHHHQSRLARQLPRRRAR